MIVPSRRGFIAGALALVAAPAIVRAASLMPVKSYPVLWGIDFGTERNVNLLTINQITRDAVKMFRNSNLFIRDMNRQYDEAFAASGAKIGDTLRIRMPRDYLTIDGPGLSVQAITDDMLYMRSDADNGWQKWPAPSAKEVLGFGIVESVVPTLAVAIAAPVVVAKVLEVPVSRRFFGKRDA